MRLTKAGMEIVISGINNKTETQWRIVRYQNAQEFYLHSKQPDSKEWFAQDRGDIKEVMWGFGHSLGKDFTIDR